MFALQNILGSRLAPRVPPLHLLAPNLNTECRVLPHQGHCSPLVERCQECRPNWGRSNPRFLRPLPTNPSYWVGVNFRKRYRPDHFPRQLHSRSPHFLKWFVAGFACDMVLIVLAGQ